MPEEKLPDHAELERVIQDAPRAVIGRLPNNLEARRAMEHIDIAYRYAKDARERKADRS
jgi:hypothetical protein